MKNISDIAKLAGVSKSTVSRYLNDGSVSKKTRLKLSKIINEHDYQPNQFAQSLRATQTHLIGAIIPRMNSYAVDETIKGIVSQCHQHHYQLSLNYTGLQIEAEIDAIETLSRSKVDAIILMATDITESHLEVIDKADVPIIIVGQNYPGLHSITHDDYQAGLSVGNWIGQRQPHHVHFFSVTENDIAVGIHRKNGLLDGLASHQIKPSIFETSFKYENALEDVQQYLSQIDKVDVLVGATDAIALAIHKYSFNSERNCKPTIIHGFGGDPMTQIVSPSIRTIQFNYFEAGKRAMTEVRQLLKNEKTEESVVIPVKL